MLVSLIIPVYNAENKLNRCVDSILSSYYKEFELILVDDGSIDHSGSICDYYASKFQNVKVIHQENQGASVARNTGIQHATGEWISFADADDEVTPQYLMDLVSAADAAFQGLIINGVEKIMSGEHFLLSLTPGKYQNEQIGTLFKNGSILAMGFPVAKLYNSSILNEHQIRFDPEIHMCEDLLFNLEYISHIQEIRVIPGHNYLYFLEKESTSSKYYSFESEWSCYKQINALLCQISNKFSFEISLAIQQKLGVTLFRPIMSLYLNGKHTFTQRMDKLNLFLQYHSKDIKKYYVPRLLQFKIAKRLLFFSTALFDLYMRLILLKHRQTK